jgi:hypothetical protein
MASPCHTNRTTYNSFVCHELTKTAIKLLQDQHLTVDGTSLPRTYIARILPPSSRSRKVFFFDPHDAGQMKAYARMSMGNRNQIESRLVRQPMGG